MRFQARDGRLLQAIYKYDGVLARRQLMEMFWSNSSARAMEKRLAKLHQTGYIAWPTLEQRRTRPIPESILWLDWRGILWVAGRSGISIPAPSHGNENQMRKLEKRLREKGIHWVREPLWAQLGHDLAVVDFRLRMEKAVRRFPGISLEEWVNESAFRRKPDIIEYELRRNGGVRQVRKKMIPDGYFAIDIFDGKYRLHEGAARARFLLEVDMATHDNPSFCKEKVLPGIAYILSSSYQRRFGDNSGRWLIVTTGERRLLNLKRQVEAEAGEGASIFYFTTFDQVRPDTILSAPIWKRGGDTEQHKLFKFLD